MAQDTAGAAGTRAAPMEVAAPRHGAAPFPPWWRWAALGWMVAWTPAYAVTWGWRNFLALCDVAVALTCIGVWRRSALLLSTQALPAVLVGVLWTADVAGRLATGRHFIGGTEYMWDARFPLAVRLLSLFHVALPVVLVAALRRVGYDRRSLMVQTALTVVLLVAARLLGTEDKNLNYAFRDPLWGRTWGPVPAHLALILVGTAVLVYLPTHLAFARALPPPGKRPPAVKEGSP